MYVQVYALALSIIGMSGNGQFSLVIILLYTRHLEKNEISFIAEDTFTSLPALEAMYVLQSVTIAVYVCMYLYVQSNYCM